MPRCHLQAPLRSIWGHPGELVPGRLACGAIDVEAPYMQKLPFPAKAISGAERLMCFSAVWSLLAPGFLLRDCIFPYSLLLEYDGVHPYSSFSGLVLLSWPTPRHRALFLFSRRQRTLLWWPTSAVAQRTCTRLNNVSLVRSCGTRWCSRAIHRCADEM